MDDCGTIAARANFQTSRPTSFGLAVTAASAERRGAPADLSGSFVTKLIPSVNLLYTFACYNYGRSLLRAGFLLVPAILSG
jgi:hypothetical protein